MISSFNCASFSSRSSGNIVLTCDGGLQGSSMLVTAIKELGVGT